MAQRGPCEKGVKHIEEHFSASGKEKWVRVKKRRKLMPWRLWKERGPVLRSHLLSDMHHSSTRVWTLHMRMSKWSIVDSLFCPDWRVFSNILRYLYKKMTAFWKIAFQIPKTEPVVWGDTGVGEGKCLSLGFNRVYLVKLRNIYYYC